MKAFFQTDYLEGFADTEPIGVGQTRLDINLGPEFEGRGARKDPRYLEEVIDLLRGMGYTGDFRCRRLGTPYVFRGLVRSPHLGDIASIRVYYLKPFPDVPGPVSGETTYGTLITPTKMDASEGLHRVV